MSTRAALFLPTSAGRWKVIYSHYDGYPSAMLPALAAHRPEDILAAGEIRTITTEKINAYPDPRDFGFVERPTVPEWASYAYELTETGWAIVQSA